MVSSRDDKNVLAGLLYMGPVSCMLTGATLGNFVHQQLSHVVATGKSVPRSTQDDCAKFPMLMLIMIVVYILLD